VTTPEDDAKAAKLRETLRQKLEAEAAVATTPAPAPKVEPQPAKPVASTPATPVYQPVAKPQPTPAPAFVVVTPTTEPTIPSPFSASKQQRLAELLERYKADAITPQEYHTQRAAIIAEP
jgi:hypothetical protein